MPRPRLNFDRWQAVRYAIGEIRGCNPTRSTSSDRSNRRERRAKGKKRVVLDGDKVAPGPPSAQALDHLGQPAPPGGKAPFPDGNCQGRRKQASTGCLVQASGSPQGSIDPFLPARPVILEKVEYFAVEAQ